VKDCFSHARPLLAALATIVGVAACDETLEGGAACPALCPGAPAAVQETTFTAVAFDTTIPGYPPLGSEEQLLLASRGDTVDTRAIIRFDSLPTTFRYRTSVQDSAITSIDSVYVLLQATDADTLGPNLTLELYDVDTQTGDDTARAALLPLFQPSRLLGSATFRADSILKDTLRIPLDAAKLLAKIQGDSLSRRLRVGVRLAAPQAAQIRIRAQNGGFPQYLRFRPHPDTGVVPAVLTAYSKTPAQRAIAINVADFQLAAATPPAEPSDVLRIGGAPGRRALLRFSIPPAVLDSSVIIRAQLLLTQRPNAGAPDALDSAGVQPYAIAAGSAVTDLNRLLFFLAAPQDSVRVIPADGRVVPFEIINLVKNWRGTDTTRTPRYVALRATTEGLEPWIVDFYSTDAPEALRPRLKITYVRQSERGLP